MLGCVVYSRLGFGNPSPLALLYWGPYKRIYVIMKCYK